MHGEPHRPLPMNASTQAGGEVPNLREHLLSLDAVLDRRAACIEAELQEIALVRKRIEAYLTPPGTGTVVPLSSGLGGASLGQMI